MSGFLFAVAITATATLAATGLLYLIKRVWQHNPIRRHRQRKQAEEEDSLLLWEIRVRSHDRLEAAVLIEKAAQQAQIENPAPALERLKSKGLIIPAHGTSPAYVQITPDGLRAASHPPPERRWWGFWR
jgi:hypothetical protein